jgi:outer membrane protein
VVQQYLTALQSQARAVLQDTLVANARVQLELARARASVGSGTGLDVQRAEVALGQQQVQQLQTHSQTVIDRLHLFQQMGVPQPSGATLKNSFSLDIAVPAVDALLTMAQQHNPGVNALRLRERAANVGVSRARGAYTPTLSLSTGLGGYTYQYRDPNFLVNQASTQLNDQRTACIDLQGVRAAAGLSNFLVACRNFTLTDAQAATIRSQNSQFPFNFTNSPRSVSAQLSIPIFDGFVREQRVQEAQVQHDNARYARKERELALTTDVTAAYLTLQTAQQTVALQEQNATKAKQELKFVQDQYAVGIATFVDLTTSRAAYAQAENDRITAVYDYHKAFAALESAVGRPLR